MRYVDVIYKNFHFTHNRDIELYYPVKMSDMRANHGYQPDDHRMRSNVKLTRMKSSPA